MEEDYLKRTLIMSGKRAVLGNSSPSVRAIAIGLKETKTLLIKCYLDKDPSEVDYEALSEIAAEILADVDLDNVEEICEFNMKPISELNSLDSFIYVR